MAANTTPTATSAVTYKGSNGTYTMYQGAKRIGMVQHRAGQWLAWHTSNHTMHTGTTRKAAVTAMLAAQGLAPAANTAPPATHTYRATGHGTMAGGQPTPTYTAYSNGVAVATVTRWVPMAGSNAWGATATATGATGAGATRSAAVAAALAAL